MENKVRNKHSATVSSGQPEKSSEDSPLSSIVSSLSSLSHGFEDDEDQHSVQPDTPPHGSPPLEPIPDLSRARVTSSQPPLPPPPPVPVVNRYVKEETVPIKKTDKAAEDGYVGRLPEVVGGGGGGDGQRRRVRSTGKEGWMNKFALGFRVLEVLFCVVSLSVMATDKSKGWALDSYYRYKEFRYCMGVNVIGFAYSVLQGCDLVYQLATGSHGTRRHYLRYYFDFAMDQASFLDLVLLFL
ncbi:CASP-like protein 4A3 [Tanacetum coccineum]